MKNVSGVNDSECLGCTACYSFCPFNAISMEENIKGFLVPRIDDDKCINCGRCTAVCPAIHTYKPKNNPGQVFAVKHRCDFIRKQSTSGGAFSAMAEALSDKNAVIYGAVSEMSDVFHRRVDDGDISLLRGSKYVQSNLKNSYKEIREDLRQKRSVLFVGTPCQCDGLNRFLMVSKTDTSRLIMVDFICHGTPSRKIYRDYIAYCEKKDKKKIVFHIFRSKTEGWHNHLEENQFEDMTTDSKSFHSQIFVTIFQTVYALKENCYKCQYATSGRCSDITIGDFWGIDKRAPEIDDNKGISFVMVNTQKGQALFEKLSENVNFLPMRLSDTDNPHLYGPVKRPDETDSFWRFYLSKGFDRMAVKYCAAGKLRRSFSKIYHFVFR